MTNKFQTAMISLAISTILITTFFSFSDYLLSFYTYSLFIGCALLIVALPLSFIVDRIKVSSYLGKSILRYIIYILPGLILYLYFQELTILLFSSIVSTIFFLVEIVFLVIKDSMKNIVFISLTIIFIFLLIISMFSIGA